MAQFWLRLIDWPQIDFPAVQQHLRDVHPGVLRAAADGCRHGADLMLFALSPEMAAALVAKDGDNKGSKGCSATLASFAIATG